MSIILVRIICNAAIDFGDPGIDLDLGTFAFFPSTIHCNYSTSSSKILGHNLSVLAWIEFKIGEKHIYNFKLGKICYTYVQIHIN